MATALRVVLPIWPPVGVIDRLRYLRSSELRLSVHPPTCSTGANARAHRPSKRRASDAFTGPGQRRMYVRHGHEFMTGKSPVGGPDVIRITTSPGQEQAREGVSEGSPRANVRADEQKSHERLSLRASWAARIACSRTPPVRTRMRNTLATAALQPTVAQRRAGLCRGLLPCLAAYRRSCRRGFWREPHFFTITTST